jgi:8-oxo-dGTP diphosphatase
MAERIQIKGVLALIINDGLVLLGKKVHKPGHFLSDAWHFPGGKVQQGESPEDAVVRELREEVGLNVSSAAKLCDFMLTVDGKEGYNTAFICTTEGDPVAGDDLVDVKYFPIHDALEIHSQQGLPALPKEVIEYLRGF